MPTKMSKPDTTTPCNVRDSRAVPLTPSLSLDQYAVILEYNACITRTQRVMEMSWPELLNCRPEDRWVPSAKHPRFVDWVAERIKTMPARVEKTIREINVRVEGHKTRMKEQSQLGVGGTHPLTVAFWAIWGYLQHSNPTQRDETFWHSVLDDLKAEAEANDEGAETRDFAERFGVPNTPEIIAATKALYERLVNRPTRETIEVRASRAEDVVRDVVRAPQNHRLAVHLDEVRELAELLVRETHAASERAHRKRVPFYTSDFEPLTGFGYPADPDVQTLARKVVAHLCTRANDLAFAAELPNAVVQSLHDTIARHLTAIATAPDTVYTETTDQVALVRMVSAYRTANPS